MTRTLIIAALLLASLAAWQLDAGSIRGRLGFETQRDTPAAEPARAPTSIAVETATATAARSTDDIQAIGTLQSDESVQITSEIAGRVTEMPLSEGRAVAQNDVLVKLDDALARAEVADAEARFDFAAGNLGRANTLARTGNVTERARDEAEANSATARATVELAKVRLDKHVIRAPFAGVVGIRRVSPGAYVTAGQPIVNLEKIDALKLDFKVPERFLAGIKSGQDVEIEVDALPGRTFHAAIYAIDPHIDVNGRALSIRARLENPDLALRPGLFARIRIKGLETRPVVLVPESAIVSRGEEKLVFRIEGGAALETKVKLGNRANGSVEITEGLSAGTVVVTAGQQKLKNGSPVEVMASGSSAAKG